MLHRSSPLVSVASLCAITACAMTALLTASCRDAKSKNGEAPSATPTASAAPGSASSGAAESASSAAASASSAAESASGASSAGPESSASASASAMAEPPPSDSVLDTADATEAPGEARRKTLRSVADDPAFYANRNFFAEKYGGARLPLPLSLQSVFLPRGRRALLITGQGAALDKPLIIAVDKDNTIAWSKDRPLAGTRERAHELTLARGSRGEVLLFWYDESTKIFAAREWSYEGGIFADYAVLSSEGCDAAAVLHWPGRGWVAALVDPAGLHCQLLGDQGTLQWPGDGVKIPLAAEAGPSAPPVARATIAILHGDTVEVTVSKRKITISRQGAVTSGAR